jgi:allophanate hydrolase subunit 1
MKTFFSKSILLVFMFLGLSVMNLEAEEIKVVTDEINIELVAGFTIEDIIQDLHDKTGVVDITAYGTNSNFTIEFNSGKVDKAILVAYLEVHKGVKKIIFD